MKLTKHNISALETKQRVLFINSLSGFKSANLVGTADANRQSNLAIVSSVVHLGANPPLLGMVMRPHTVPRGSLENILNTGVYTLSHVNQDIYQQAHQTSARYPDDVSEFDEVGLTEQWEDGFAAPFVAESRIKLGMQFRERHTLDINGTEFVIGEIVSIEMPDEIVSDDGFVSLEKAGTVAVSSLDTYHSTNTLASLSYAKPDRQTTLLNRDHGGSLSIVQSRTGSGSDPKCVLVVAASGGIGEAYCKNIIAQFPDAQLIRMARNTKALPPLGSNVVDIEVDLGDDQSIDNAITALPENTSIDWVFVASGWLHDEQMKPEKTYRRLTREQMLHSYNINAVGPTLFISRLLGKVDKKQPLKIGVLSARVGSVSDNRLGGWHSYRASKSALHMLIKNIAIECRNVRKTITIVGLQPGTTDTALSAPYQKGLTEAQLQTPEFTANNLIKVMNALESDDSGKLFDFKGVPFQP
jgi:NAD(P)-dependent dehydrogenase (short-subunit alcohol dehydrogenase family)/flavin reductase (DIM6/NTAB) family NADH-FMN oxidoreductase RutF